MAIVKGVPDIVIYAGGALAVYFIFFREDPIVKVQAGMRARTEREKFLAATHGQRITGHAEKSVSARFTGGKYS